MNRSALKTYAPKARLDFIRAVTDRAAFHGLTKDRTEPMEVSGDVVLIGGRAFPKAVAQQRRSLEDRIQRHGFDQVIEAMAYTWFNRFVALRYMELHGFLDHGYRVLSHPASGSAPEILEHAEHVTLPGLDSEQVVELKLNGGQDAVLYRLLLVAQCNALHEAMPFLFEKIADETELLLPDNLLHSDSVIRKLVNEIDDADWQQVEIIGWLYQFYISDKKDAVIGKVVKSEDIPAATQLFTPNWIVKYLVQNTLGRQWLATYPDSPLRQKMEYYIEPAGQTDDVKAQLAAITPKSLDPETLTLLDPASGSGHILVEAYDLFKAIYQERGYRSKDIPRLILQKNLFGLEIDDRAAQLAAFALLMKARADDRSVFADRVQPNVVAIQESVGLENLLRPDPAAAGTGELSFAENETFPQTQKQLTLNKPEQGTLLKEVEPSLRGLIKLFEHGKTFGSLIGVPQSLVTQLPTARQHIEVMIATGQLWEHRVATLMLPLVKQAELLGCRYNIVVTNPPYMGSKGMNSALRDFARRYYPNSKSDLFAVFAERVLEMVTKYGFVGLMTPFTWMFIKSYEHLRLRMCEESDLLSLIQPEYHAFFESAYVPICAYVVQRAGLGLRGDFVKLSEFYGEDVQPIKALEAIRNPKCGWRFTASSAEFKKIPGTPIAYWISPVIRDLFASLPPLGHIAQPRKGNSTSDNDRFLRLWHEVDHSKIGLNLPQFDRRFRWIPYNKGGGFRKWYGLNQYLIDWENQGVAIRNIPTAVIANEDYFFKPGLTWSTITVKKFSIRQFGQGYIFDNGGCCLFSDDDKRMYLLALMNSNVFETVLEQINPTLNFQSGEVAKFPTLIDDRIKSEIERAARECVEVTQQDWDFFESSWDFQRHPFLSEALHDKTLEASFDRWSKQCAERIRRVGVLETQNNRLFIGAYKLDGQVSTDVVDEYITLARSHRGHDIESLISYTIGCMMGRYSLDRPGLIYAHRRDEGFNLSQYQTFSADPDGIIPITELAWFPDDATERFVEFIGKAWPREHLEENLKFIADSLGPNRDEHPRDTIRRYLATSFYKDHLSIYKKRPLYWLFSSGRQRAFQCLVYLHRYHEGTLARMRTEYVIPLQGKLSHRIEQLAGDILAATSTSHRRRLEKERDTMVKQRAELAAFDEKLRHYADQRIALDLDDGVKVNYGKFGDLLAEVKSVTGGSEE